MKKVAYWKELFPLMEEDGNSGATGGAAPAAGGSSQGEEGSGNAGEDAKPKSFEALLKENPDYQKDLDRRITQAVETATKNERERQRVVQDQMQDEMIRVSKMTDEEKDEYLKAKAKAKADEREADLVKRELTLDARAALQEKGLPESFLGLLNYQNKEVCLASVDALDEAFREAVQKGVDDKLKGQQPPKDAKTEGASATPPDAQAKAAADMFKFAGVKPPTR